MWRTFFLFVVVDLFVYGEDKGKDMLVVWVCGAYLGEEGKEVVGCIGSVREGLGFITLNLVGGVKLTTL